MPVQNYSAETLELKLMINRTIRAVNYLRDEARRLEDEFAETLQKISPDYRESARNLLHYVALRRHDMRDLQHDLRVLGLTSLGGAEAHVMASLNSLLLALNRLTGQSSVTLETLDYQPALDHRLGDALLAEHAVVTLGPLPRGRTVRIMVTMPSEAADDPTIAHDLLDQGMDIVRINCAHDGPAAWLRMIEHVRQAQQALSKSCRIAFDLGGPKLRTGPITPGPEVVRWRPTRNRQGQVVAPATIHLTTSPPVVDAVIQTQTETGETILPIGGAWLEAAQVGDVIRLKDARGRKRRLDVKAVTESVCVCESDRTGYVVSGLKLALYRGKKLVGEDKVGRLPALAQAIDLSAGDTLLVTPADRPGRPAVVDETGAVVEPAQIGCTLPEAFRDVRVGERIFLDDGKFSGLIRETGEDQFQVEIVSAAGGTARLQAEKGINLPDTQLDLPALTPKDIEDLEFVGRHGDLVSLSFVQRSEDIEHLVSEMERLQAQELGIILKIEGQTAFNNLPRLLLTALRHPPVAVMVARGDLGVEVGFERLAEVQEEILWLCEAAHVPVIWATQVLENLAKRGVPSRAEVTDAAMAVRAECVMLNKGPYIAAAVKFLRDVLRRMQDHQAKKSAQLRRLRVTKL